MTTEQMIAVVDSYYLTQADYNAKRLKCSLIAAFATELGYSAEGYDFARNLEVREHIERLKCFAEVHAENHISERAGTSYKNLDVEGLIRNNREHAQLAKALTELDAYWRRIYEPQEHTASVAGNARFREKSLVEMRQRPLLAGAGFQQKRRTRLSILRWR